MKVKHAVAAAVLSMGLALQSVSAAYAQNPPDRLFTARSGILGHTTKNWHTHVWTTTVGTYAYQRWVHVAGVGWRKKTFYNPIVSAQHCGPDRCWGKVVGGKLRSPYQPGRTQAPGHAPVTIEGAQNYCLSSLQCAAVWHWPTKYITAFDKGVAEHFARPCVSGSLTGVGVKAAHQVAAAAMAEGAALSTAQRAASVFGPEGYGTLALAGCFVGVGSHTTNSIKKIVSSLNPFDRSLERKR